MQLRAIGLWNSSGELRRIDLHSGLNIITGASQTGKSALIEIIRYCLGSTELRVPAGPIADTVAYYGILVQIEETLAFIGRPALAQGQQTSSEAQLEVGIADFPLASDLRPTTNTETVRRWIGTSIGIEENKFDPPEGSSRPPLVANLAHALIHCFQRQDEIASRQVLFHGQNDPFVAQAIRDTLPYFLGVTGPEQLRLASQLREHKRRLADLQRQRRQMEETFRTGLDEALTLLSQAADAGLVAGDITPPNSLPTAIALLTQVRDAPVPPSPLQPAGEEFDRLQSERRELAFELRRLREQRELAAAIEHGGTDAELEGVEQVVRLQSIGLLHGSEDPTDCPVCGQTLLQPIPAVDQIGASLEGLHQQLTAVARDRPGLVEVQHDLRRIESGVRTRLEANANALERLAQSAEAVEAHQSQLDLGTWVRGRIDHYLETTLTLAEPEFASFQRSEQSLLSSIAELEELLDPQRIREAATSVLVGVGLEMTGMAQALGLEHADRFVRIDLSRLTVVADTATGPVYMSTNIGSGKNWVGYHLTAVLGLQQHFVMQARPVPRFLVLDQPTQAFFPADRPEAEVSDQDRADARAQFEVMQQTVTSLNDELQILVLDHADFDDQEWFDDAVVERWRDGRALIPAEWIGSPPGTAPAPPSRP